MLEAIPPGCEIIHSQQVVLKQLISNISGGMGLGQHGTEEFMARGAAFISMSRDEAKHKGGHVSESNPFVVGPSGLSETWDRKKNREEAEKRQAQADAEANHAVKRRASEDRWDALKK